MGNRPGNPGPVWVRPYKGRHWAVYDQSGLVAVTVYRKGAECVARRLALLRLRHKGRRRAAWN